MAYTHGHTAHSRMQASMYTPMCACSPTLHTVCRPTRVVHAYMRTYAHAHLSLSCGPWGAPLLPPCPVMGRGLWAQSVLLHCLGVWVGSGGGGSSELLLPRTKLLCGSSRLLRPGLRPGGLCVQRWGSRNPFFWDGEAARLGSGKLFLLSSHKHLLFTLPAWDGGVLLCPPAHHALAQGARGVGPARQPLCPGPQLPPAVAVLGSGPLHTPPTGPGDSLPASSPGTTPSPMGSGTGPPLCTEPFK